MSMKINQLVIFQGNSIHVVFNLSVKLYVLFFVGWDTGKDIGTHTYVAYLRGFKKGKRILIILNEQLTCTNKLFKQF